MFIKMRESKGFTLVELMIVVAIIGILAAVAVPFYQKYIQKSRLTSLVWPGVHIVQTDVAAYYSLNTVFPSNTQIITMMGDANTHFFTASIAGTAITFTLQNVGGTTPLSAFKDTDSLIASIGTTKNGVLANWIYNGTVAQALGLTGVQ
jgi:type IV pilus assembly protein PilA